MSTRGQDGLLPGRSLTPAQIREARRLLGWRQPDLAVAAGLATTTVMRIEDGSSVLRRNVQAVTTALVKAGIVRDALGRVARRAMPRAEQAGMLSARAATALPRLTADQVLEARRVLGWKQATLAAEASVSVGTLSKFESGIAVRDATRAAILAALSDAGVVVDADGQVRRRPRP